ncbi:MAG TPA: hypothetical protein VL225_18590 [Vicinamibacterales bacterium]|nr:hypothetical protein [Vicinamibacterales bacterium]
MKGPLPAALAAILLIPAAAGAQPGKAGPPGRIDFRALTEDGQQVADLKVEDLTLKVNGKPRAIQSLSVFHTAAAAGEAVLPPPYATNLVGRNGRIIHILIDDDSIAPGREEPMKSAVRMLTTELGPSDRIGVLTAQGQLNIRPVDDPSKIRLAVDALAGRASSNESESDAQCRTTRVLAAVGTMLSLTGGTPTTIVVFAGGLSPPSNKVVVVGSRTSSGTSEVCPVRPEDYQNIGALAAGAHADLYMFHLIEGMVNRSSTQDAGLESLAGVTGGELIRLSGNPQASVSRLLRETSSYYVATFEPDSSERNGQALRIDLKSGRDKVKLRSRAEVTIPKSAAKTAASPKDMLRTVAEYRDLPLRTSAYASRHAGSDELKVVALFEALDAARLTSASVALFDEKNTLKRQWTAQASDFTTQPVMAALTAPAGVYRMRVAALDDSGRAGTADYELSAELSRADPLKLSALVLGTQQTGGAFAPLLDFKDAAVAIGVLEIYGAPTGGSVTIDLDVASTPEGPALAKAETTVSPPRADGVRTAIGGFNIANLNPGDYLMRAVVSLDGKPVGKVVRTLRKSP